MSQIIIKKPVSVFRRELKVNLKELFLSVSKVAVGTHLLTAISSPAAFPAFTQGLFDIAKSFGLKDISVEELAWMLIVNSLRRTLVLTFDGQIELSTTNQFNEDELNKICEKIVNKVDKLNIILTDSFLDNPVGFLDDFDEVLIEWFELLTIAIIPSSKLQRIFRERLSQGLHDEWTTNHTQYSKIENHFNSPFKKDIAKQEMKQKYRDILKNEIDKPMFEEDFGLSKVYIPLRAYYQCQNQKINSSLQPLDDHENPTKIACNIHEEIQDWLQVYNKDDNLRIISGGPGSGKSSFAKILASELAEQMQPVIFIPLHIIEFDKYLLTDIKEFINLELSSDEADSITAEHGLLFIFDGLDELTMQGDNIKEKANDFVTMLDKFLYNNQNKEWKALVTGREIAVQTQNNVLSEEKNIFYLLPYFVSEDEREQYQNNTILKADQRNEWWAKYAPLKNLDYTSLPTVIATEHLEPITSEPLLSYLVAISFLNSDIVFDNETSLNQIYASLLDSVYNRTYSSHKHTSLQKIETRDNFEAVLQAVAVAVWQHNGRTAKVSQILAQCEKDDLSQYFDDFEKSAKEGAVNLLMSFYFREFGSKEGDKTFEFTHKSFGEYLTARRILREIADIFEEYEFNCKKRGEPTALINAFESWIKLFGKQEFDYDIGTFVEGELKIISEQDNGLLQIEKYQTLMIDLINLAIDNKSPVKNLHLATFAEDLLYRQNSERAILQMHSLCGELTNKKVKEIGSASMHCTSIWLNNIQHNSWAPLNHLDFEEQIFKNVFNSAIFKNSDFANITFIHSSLINIQFFNIICIGMNFYNVNFWYSSFFHCDAKSSNFFLSILRTTKMKGVNCSNSCFRSTIIINSFFEKVDFTNANFARSTIDQATIDKFKDVTFKDTIVTGTLLANDPDAITDEDDIVRLTKIFNPTNKEEK